MYIQLHNPSPERASPVLIPSLGNLNCLPECESQVLTNSEN